jgi:type I restriction enzyme R subunit
MYEPAMRHLIDSYIRAEPTRVVSALEDMSLVQLIVQHGTRAVDALPQGIRSNPGAMAEAIENNVRKLIIDEAPVNPKYYEKMSQLLDALIAERKRDALEYEEYLRKLVELTRQAANPQLGSAYPAAMNTPGKRALYDNLQADETLAARVDAAVRASRQDDWRCNIVKVRRVRNAIRIALGGEPVDASRPIVSRERTLAPYADAPETPEARVERILQLVVNQHEY